MKGKLLTLVILSSITFVSCTNDIHVRVANKTLDKININNIDHIYKGITKYVFTLTPDARSDSFVICRSYREEFPCLARVTVTMTVVPGGGQIGGNYETVTLTENPRDVFHAAYDSRWIVVTVENFPE